MGDIDVFGNRNAGCLFRLIFNLFNLHYKSLRIWAIFLELVNSRLKSVLFYQIAQWSAAECERAVLVI